MGKCKNCKYWEIDDFSEVRYSSNFGYCNCNKFAYRQDLYDKNCELNKKKCDNCHVIYSDSEGMAADLRMHKEFGCINFVNKK